MLLSVLLFAPPAFGFIGMSIPMYKPPCAHACRDMIASAVLDCPADLTEHQHGMVMRDMEKRHGHDHTVTPACRAQNLPFLTTLAYCVEQKCGDVPRSAIEGFWETAASGGVMYRPTAPHWSYAESLAQVNGTPNEVYDPEATLSQTVLVNDTLWREDCLTIDNFAHGEALHARYSVIILSIGVGLPILATIFTLALPNLTLKLKPYLIYPALYRHHLPVFHWFHPPNAGQTLYLVLFISLNIILSAVGYASVQPSSWYATKTQEIVSKIAARTGIIAMALAPLTFLLAGRNNILLYLTQWDHSTYLLLHRWVARIFTLHVLVHSIGELWAYVDNGSYAENLVEPYWNYGCLPTVACVALCIKSIFRTWKYQLFLLLHILLAVLVLVGTWYHLILRFDYRWGYHWMLYACFAVWIADRVMRLALIIRNGWRRARITALGGGVVRVDIDSANFHHPGSHAYIYFPHVRRWAPWECHPFSAVPTYLLLPKPSSANTTAQVSHQGSTPDLAEKAIQLDPPAFATALVPLSPGVTFYVKVHNGLTARLATLAAVAADTQIPVLVEGPYAARSDIQCDRLVCIAGGIGITAVLPLWANHHNAKLYWSIRTTMTPLVDDISHSSLLRSEKEKEVKIGERFDIREVLVIEAGCGGVLGVVVCGPKSMCEDVRKVVSQIGRRGQKVDFRCEAFSS